MSPRSHHRGGRWLLALTIVLATVALRAPISSAQESPPETSATPTPTPMPAPASAGRPGPLVFGAGTATLGEDFPAEYRGDQIFVAVHVRTLANQSIGGIFTIAHHKPNGELLAEIRGEISCLRVEGDHALATGVITSTRTPGAQGGVLHEGLTAGIIVRDGGAERDRMAWSFGEAGPNCDEIPAATTTPVERGNFVVRK